MSLQEQSEVVETEPLPLLPANENASAEPSSEAVADKPVKRRRVAAASSAGSKRAYVSKAKKEALEQTQDADLEVKQEKDANADVNMIEEVETSDEHRKDKLLVHKAIRNYLKHKMPTRIHCGTQALLALEARISKDLDVAAKRVLDNRRKTMKPCDI